jgi:ADP-ribose pyrophosphatase
MTGPREVLHEGRYLRLVRRGRWEYVERTTGDLAAVIFALTPSGNLLLVEQFRIPVGARVIELPAGLVGDIAGAEDESALVAAGRELEEETGWRAGRLEVVGGGPISPGLTTETMVLVRARDLVRTGPGGGDDHEDITVHEIPLGDLRSFLAERQRAGCLVDPKVLLAGVLCMD